MADSTRMSQFKNKGKEADTLRKNRIDEVGSSRQIKRDDLLSARRDINVVSNDSECSLPPPQPTGGYDTALLKDIATRARGNATERLGAVEEARKLLSATRNDLIRLSDEIIQSGLVPTLVACLEVRNPYLQYQAAWSLANIMAGTSAQTQAVVDQNAVPIFLKLLQSPTPLVSDVAVWALGNVVGDGPDSRDFCIDSEIFRYLLPLVLSRPRKRLLERLCQVLALLNREKELPSTPDIVQTSLPDLARLTNDKDPNFIVAATWAIAYLCGGGKEQKQKIVQSGVVRNLISLLNHSDARVQSAALRAIGNIATGTLSQTQHLLDSGVLKRMPQLLFHDKKIIVKKALWCLSNFTVEDQNQVHAVIDAGLVPRIIELLEKGDLESQKEAAYVVSNVTATGRQEHVNTMVEGGVVAPFCSLLSSRKEAEVIKVVLYGINNMLKKAGPTIDVICKKIRECGGLAYIGLLQHNYPHAHEIVRNYFSDETVDDGSVAGPSGLLAIPADREYVVEEAVGKVGDAKRQNVHFLKAVVISKTDQLRVLDAIKEKEHRKKFAKKFAGTKRLVAVHIESCKPLIKKMKKEGKL